MAAEPWTWSSWQVILLLLNAGFGLIMFEWAWYVLYRFRKPISDLDEMLPAFRRNDAKKWRKLLFYPGAVTMLLPRMLVVCSMVLVASFFSQLFLCCHPKDKPIRGCRRFLIKLVFRVAAFLFQIFANFAVLTWSRMSMADVNHYEKWLGPLSEQDKEQFGGILAHHQTVHHEAQNSTDASDNMQFSPINGNRSGS